MRDLRGTTAVVTGASRGIGVYIARALAAEGVNLSLAARSADDLARVRAEMETLGVRAIAVTCDVVSAEDRTRLIEKTESQLGPIDILVNNAGIERVARFERAKESDIVDTLTVNLEAPMLLTRAIVPGMLERGRGHVVNIASGAGKAGVPYGTSYCASKHGLVGFTHALNAEYHQRDVGFSVVCPAFVTDAGMYDRWVRHGVRAPRIAGSSTPEKVAAATIRCITRNKVEAVVNTPPLRPTLVLWAAFPSIVPGMMRRLGYSKVFERVIEFESGDATG